VPPAANEEDLFQMSTPKRRLMDFSSSTWPMSIHAFSEIG
jgi:hypothetical protein